MSRLIIDTTQLVHHTGKLTGIPRVMDELSRRFFELNRDDVVFASWVKDEREFYEVDFDQTILQRNGVVYKKQSSQPAAESAASSEPAPAATGGLKHQLKRVAKKGLSLTSKVSPALADKVRSRATQLSMQGNQKIEFRSGDMLFIPWGEWWDGSFTDRLERAHNEQGVQLVQIIHDVATTVWPQFFEPVGVRPTEYNARIVPIASLVLCVSQNTKRELVGWLEQEGLNVPKIEVFRLGDDIRAGNPTKPAEEAFTKSGLQGDDFLLCVGTIEAKKNHALFYYVYKLASARGIELPRLAIVGRRGWHTENIYDMMTRDPEVCDKFVFLHNVSDDELVWLFDHAKFSVLPSFHEGWGIPIAESLNRGLPCACSNTSSMVEIAEGIVEHFSPASPEECLAIIQKLLDPKELEVARTRTQQYQPFTWDASFKQVMAYLEEK